MKRRVHNSQFPATLLDHIRELRTRLLVSVIILVIAGIVAYFFYDQILTILRSPLGAPLYYSNPAGSFSFVMKICTMAGIAVAIPVVVYNLIMFVRPAFKDALPILRVYSMTVASVLLAATGVVFAFTFIIPGALRFFAGFQVEGLSALISADSYLTFVTNVIITFVLVFQIPLILLFIDRIKPIPPKNMLKGEKWVILGGLIVSFMVPFALDITTSLLIAAPIIVLYNISIILVLWQHASIRRAEQRVQKRAGTVLAKQSLTTPAVGIQQVVSVQGTVLSAETSIRDATPTSPSRTVRSMDIVRTHRHTSPVGVTRSVAPPPRPKSNFGNMRLISDIKLQ